MTLFAPPSVKDGHIVPRPYQEEALEALDSHIRAKESNPCVVIPTGGGKSVLIAWTLQNWKRDYPPFRCIILAHRKELVLRTRKNSCLYGRLAISESSPPDSGAATVNIPSSLPVSTAYGISGGTFPPGTASWLMKRTESPPPGKASTVSSSGDQESRPSISALLDGRQLRTEWVAGQSATRITS